MKKKIKNYMISADESQVFAISVVECPAIESDFIYMSNQEDYTTTEEKHLVYGAILRPNFPIYRRYGDQEFYVTFSKEVIEKLSQDFMKNFYQKKWTEAHGSSIDGLTVVESWIKTSDNDKSISLGLDNLEIGTWFIGCKVDNEDIWEKIKNKEFKGFSIEAFVNFEQFSKMDESFWERLKSIIEDALKPAPVVEEEVVEEPMTDEEVAVEVANDVKEIVEETVVDEKEALMTIIDELKKKVEELEAKNNELTEANANLQAENVKLSKQPSVKPLEASSHITANPREIIEQIKNGTYKF